MITGFFYYVHYLKQNVTFCMNIRTIYKTKTMTAKELNTEIRNLVKLQNDEKILHFLTFLL